jgi:hypothetical protein
MNRKNMYTFILLALGPIHADAAETDVSVAAPRTPAPGVPPAAAQPGPPAPRALTASVTCGEPAQPQRIASAGQDSQAAPPAPSGEATPPTTADLVAASAECYQSCYTGHLTDTNRESCKLQCDAAADVALTSSHVFAAAQVRTHLSGCLADCWEGPALKATDRETCLLTCTDGAETEATPVRNAVCTAVEGSFVAYGAQFSVDYVCPVR